MNYLKNTIIFFLIALFSFSHAYAETEITEGYDENTELTVKGSAGESLQGMRGPVILIIHVGNRDYKVVTAPRWYLVQQGIELTPGKAFEVTGSKYIAKDGASYIIASSLKNLDTGKIYSLRDSSCMPRWKGQRMRKGMGPAFQTP